MTSTAVRWTSADLETFPTDGKRREIIDGELYVSKQPNWYHQAVCIRIGGLLDAWSLPTNAGMAAVAPGLIFADDDGAAIYDPGRGRQALRGAGAGRGGALARREKHSARPQDQTETLRASRRRRILDRRLAAADHRRVPPGGRQAGARGDADRERYADLAAAAGDGHATRAHLRRAAHGGATRGVDRLIGRGRPGSP